jgi:outer membrane protein
MRRKIIMRGTIITLLASAAALGVALPAQAQTEIQSGDVLLRVRGILVAPNESSGSILPGFPGERVSASNSVMPEVDITWMATPHFGFELIAATTKHNASGISGTTGSIGRLASTWVLPPTLTAQYHPIARGPVRPYVGAGINYTIFYSEHASNGLEAAVGPTRVQMSDSVGWAVQAGVDVDLGGRWFANLDVKYIDMDTTARLTTTLAGTQRVRMHLDPLVVGVGIGTRF